MSARLRLAVLAVLAAGGTAFGGYHLWPSGRHIASCALKHAPVPPAAQKADALWTIPEGKFDRTVWLTYDDRTYTDDRDRALTPRRTALVLDGQANRDKVFNGRATVVGHAAIAGKDTLHLDEHVHIPRTRIPIPKSLKLPKGFPIPRGLRFSPVVDYQLDTWVDPGTYLTLRTRVTEHGKVSVTDVAWLPRTSANLADMELRIPNGFEREPVQHGSGVGFAVLTTTATSARCA